MATSLSVVSIVVFVQGLTIPMLLDGLGVVTRSEAEEVYSARSSSRAF